MSMSGAYFWPRPPPGTPMTRSYRAQSVVRFDRRKAYNGNAMKPPGRDLDALVAEEALGCKVIWVENDGYRIPTCGCVCDDDNCKERKSWGHLHQGIPFGYSGVNAHCQFVQATHDPDESEMSRVLPGYSTDDEVGMEILEWLKEKWGSVDIHMEGDVVSVGCNGEMCAGEDLAHAASLAALKAAGYTER